MFRCVHCGSTQCSNDCRNEEPKEIESFLMTEFLNDPAKFTEPCNGYNCECDYREDEQ